ncbi:hypothetical protein [Pseudomonas paeninsulae]|uniref:hypothetical protein n=1 Tax=Pseudomonas paeninsulae TaxID=3110772 RepID=UPI002D77F8D6|nr:hypothetical protein [Pseudomonas sp. IT1137]
MGLLQRAALALAKQMYAVWYRGAAVAYDPRELFVSGPDGDLLRIHEGIGERPATIS